ncbi:hypothetical protein AeMF1_013942, partial [Aphanomyces euteiches]
DLLNNLNLMSAESKKMRQQHDEEIKAKQQDVERMHRLLKTSMKEYLVLRHKFQDSQRQVQEEFKSKYASICASRDVSTEKKQDQEWFLSSTAVTILGTNRNRLKGPAR